MSSHNMIQIVAVIAITAAAVSGGAGLSRAALPPATARDPAPPIPPPRWAEIMHRRPQPVWHSVGEYLDYLAYWRAPVWPVEPTAAWQCDLCRPEWKPERKFWWRIPT